MNAATLIQSEWEIFNQCEKKMAKFIGEYFEIFNDHPSDYSVNYQAKHPEMENGSNKYIIDTFAIKHGDEENLNFSTQAERNAALVIEKEIRRRKLTQRNARRIKFDEDWKRDRKIVRESGRKGKFLYLNSNGCSIEFLEYSPQ
jgi:hypothetical protein